MPSRHRAAAALAAAIAALTATAAPADPSAQRYERPLERVRDAGFNRVVARAPSVGAGLRGGAAAAGRAGGAGLSAAATATANAVAVTQIGRGHTLVLTVRQSNSGAVAAGTTLNGRLAR
jgi:hypothetical protein